MEKEKKDLSWYFLLISFLMGVPGGIQSVKSSHLYLEEWSSFDILNAALRLSWLMGELIGASLAPLGMSSIIVGFIWIAKKIMSKSYEKPIQHIFIISVFFGIVYLFGYLNK